MAVYNGTSSDSLLNNHLSIIRTADYGSQARASIANAVDRCYTLAVIKAGYARNGVTRAVINEHINRIRNAVFGEEVRDALKTGLTLCYSARGISLSSAEQTYLTNLINAQIGEDLKNYILRSFVQCCQDVKA